MIKRDGLTLWLTGYSGSGKSSISWGLSQQLAKRNIPFEILDGDLIRESLSKDLGFSQEDRCENIKRIGFVAELLSRNGVFVIVSAISPYKSARQKVREKIKNFIEVYVNCSIEECERRDTKGLYKKAKSGLLSNFTGYDSPYEAPDNPEIICCTENEDLQDSVNKIITYLQEFDFIS